MGQHGSPKMTDYQKQIQMTIKKFIETVKQNYPDFVVTDNKNYIRIRVCLGRSCFSVFLLKNINRNINQARIEHGYSQYVSYGIDDYFNFLLNHNHGDPIHVDNLHLFAPPACIKQPATDLIAYHAKQKNYMDMFDMVMSYMETNYGTTWVSQND